MHAQFQNDAMKSSIVTGASSGIGLAIAQRLVSMNYKVYGLARDFGKTGFSHELFVPLVADLTKTGALEKLITPLLASDEEFSLLVNNAGVGYFAPHEEISLGQLQEMVTLNLTVPMLLSRLVLREIKKNQGTIINISSIAALKTGVWGAAYSASKAGLTHFGKCLFEDVRKTGAKVVNIHPDIVKTEFFDGLNFSVSAEEDSFVLPGCIADAVEDVLTTRSGTVITDLTIRPQRHQLDKKKRHE